MKKLTSILLVLTIISSCFAFVGCDWSNIFGTTTTTITGTPDPSTLNIKCGDNFTQEDIEFLRYIHGYQILFSDMPSISFSNYVDRVNNEESHSYFVSTDKANPIYLCGYLDLNDFGDTYLNVEKHVWYKYTDIESVPQERDGLILGWNIRLYNATVTKDIENGIDYEHKIKIYRVGRGGVPKSDLLYEYTVMFHNLSIVDITYLEEPNFQSYFKGYITAAGKSYFVLKYGNIKMDDGSISDCLDDNRNQLEDYYDVLYPYIERLEEMDYEFSTPSGEKRTSLVHGVPIDVLTEVLFGR